MSVEEIASTDAMVYAWNSDLIFENACKPYFFNASSSPLNKNEEMWGSVYCFNEIKMGEWSMDLTIHHNGIYFFKALEFDYPQQTPSILCPHSAVGAMSSSLSNS
jgi:hypothetical protein